MEDNNKELYDWFCAHKILEFMSRYKKEFNENPREFSDEILELDDAGFKIGFTAPENCPDFRNRLEKIVYERPALHEGTLKENMLVNYLNDVLKTPLKDEEVTITVSHKDPGFLFEFIRAKYAFIQSKKPV